MNNLAQLLFAATILAVPTYAQCSGGPDVLENNDTCATAVAIPGNAATGLNVEFGDLDFYTVTVPAGEAVTVTITHTASLGDIDGYIWDPSVACDSTIAGEGLANGSLAQAYTGLDVETMTYSNTSAAPLDLIVEVSLWSGNTTSTCNDYDIDIALTTLPNVPPLTPECVETLFASNNGGSSGGAVYFDATAGAPTSIGLILTNFSEAIGLPVGLEVYTTPGTYLGNEGNGAAWTLAAMDDANAVSAGLDFPTLVNLASPLLLPAGTTGIALVAVGTAHEYTNGTGANQTAVSGNGNLTLSLGSATNVPFTGTPFSPRVWNGRLCPTGPSSIGSPFCAANANSTGQVGTCTAVGSTVASNNDVTLTASNLPPSQFGIFVTSAALISGNTVGAGVLCLGGAVGRYNAPGQILQANASGEFSLGLNLTLTPLPSSVTSVMAGQTRSWQAWHRDFAGMSLTSNFTTGVTITFN